MTGCLRALTAIGGALLAAGCWAQEGGIMLTTDSPGGVFAYGRDVVVEVSVEGAETIGWRIMDFARQEVASGEAALADGKGAIRVADLRRGYYTVECTAGETQATLGVGVVTDHSGVAPPDGRLNVDGATSWLENQGRHEDLARMLRMIGVGWVRERFSWGATEPKKGEVGWQHYDGVADIFTEQGIRVYQIFHDSPGWTHAGNEETRNPEDLRDVYLFAKRLAEHFKGRVRAWEVWNEPDIHFWPDLGDTFAGLQKAAYLGFKAGDPELPVLLGSFCRGYCPFDDSLFEAGISEYFDIFNWHIYAPPERYPGVLARYLELLEKHRCADRPVWLTEAGIRLPGAEPDGELNAADERKQAEFVPKAFAWSLAAGTDRHFFFVYPWYLERGIQFGSLRKDLSPRPGFIAIAAAVDILGDAKYLGRHDFGEVAGCAGLAFDSGKARVLLVWSEEEREVELEVGARSVEVADVVGRRETMQTADGKLTLRIGPSPRYVMGLGEGALTHIGGEVRAPGRLPETRSPVVVIRGQAQVDKIDKGANCYLIGSAPFTYVVEVCNLHETDNADGRIRLGLPDGWSAAPAGADVSLEPMGRVVQEFAITPGPAATGTAKLWVHPRFEESAARPSVSYFRFDLSAITPAASEDLALDETGAWRENISGNGSMSIRDGEEGGVRFDIEFTEAGDRWCYPQAAFDPPRDFSGFDGVAFEYRCHADDDKTAVRLQVREPGGAAYFTTSGWKAREDWTRTACLFEDLAWGSFSARDPNQRLDTDAVSVLMIGVNTPRDEVWLQVRNVRLVKLAE